MTKYSIETMTESHCSAVLRLWEATDGVSLTDADTAAGLIAYFERNPAMSHVATRRDTIVGAVLCGHDGRRGYLHHLAVEKHHRNQGIGRKLVHACLGKLKSVGIKRCNLFIFDENSEARRFWTSDDWFEWSEIRLFQKELT